MKRSKNPNEQIIYENQKYKIIMLNGFKRTLMSNFFHNNIIVDVGRKRQTL